MLLEHSRRFSVLTEHAFNITVQPLVDLFRRHQNPRGSMSIPKDDLREARELVMTDGVHLLDNRIQLARAGMGITLDGIAKGHIVDTVSHFLIGLGMDNHLINAGGDIMAKGRKTQTQPWRVAVYNPAGTGGSRRNREFELQNRAIATSGSYETFYDASRRHHHLINPAAGASPTDMISVSVIASNALEADALATSLSVMPPKDGMRLIASLPGRACLMQTASGEVRASSGWPS
jgi:thiamine biosynthesis lipoprotein